MPPSTSDLSALVNSFEAQARTYEFNTGGCTRAIATHLVTLLPPLLPSAQILDNACGTGAVTDEVLKLHPDVHIHAADVAANMIEILNGKIKERGWESKVEGSVMPGTELRFADETFDVSITNFGLFFFPDPSLGAREIYRTLKPGGIAFVTCWRDVGFLRVFFEVQRLVKPAKEVTVQTLKEWMKKEKMEKVLSEEGFGDVRMESKEVLMQHARFEDLVRGIAELETRTVGEEWSADEKGKMSEMTERVLREDNGFLEKGEGWFGVRMVAWVAVTRK